MEKPDRKNAIVKLAVLSFFAVAGIQLLVGGDSPNLRLFGGHNLLYAMVGPIGLQVAFELLAKKTKRVSLSEFVGFSVLAIVFAFLFYGILDSVISYLYNIKEESNAEFGVLLMSKLTIGLVYCLVFSTLTVAFFIMKMLRP